MTIQRTVGLLSLIFVIAQAAGAQDEFPLWPDSAPGSESQTSEIKVREVAGGERVLSNIHQPSITAYLPDARSNSGAAIVVAPGGGHRELWADHEGHNIAKWLADHGVAAFVLKYRLARERDSPYSIEEHALADGHRAMRVVRSKADEWNIDPDRVGFLGFSAGGEVAYLACQRTAVIPAGSDDPIDLQDSRPNFQALIYPGRSRDIEPTSESPPVFIVCGYNDRPDISRGMANVYLKFKEVGVPAELHIYAAAGHGFGLRDRTSGAVAKWPERLLEWMSDQDLLTEN